MKKHHQTILKTTVVVVVLAVGYFIYLYNKIYLSTVQIEPMKDLLLYNVEEIYDLSADADFWQDIQPAEIHLYPQSAKSPFGYSEKDLLVKAAYNSDEITFLLEFNDSTETPGTPANPDACAILFTTSDAPATAQMMGYGHKANVWQWLADRNLQVYQQGNKNIKTVRELIATGPGTQTPLGKQNVDGKGDYRNGAWYIAFKRKLNSNQEGEFSFQPGQNMKIAFALWDGSKMESFSRKSISILRNLIWEK